MCRLNNLVVHLSQILESSCWNQKILSEFVLCCVCVWGGVGLSWDHGMRRAGGGGVAVVRCSSTLYEESYDGDCS